MWASSCARIASSWPRGSPLSALMGSTSTGRSSPSTGGHRQRIADPEGHAEAQPQVAGQPVQTRLEGRPGSHGGAPVAAQQPPAAKQSKYHCADSGSPQPGGDGEPRPQPDGEAAAQEARALEGLGGAKLAGGGTVASSARVSTKAANVSVGPRRRPNSGCSSRRAAVGWPAATGRPRRPAIASAAGPPPPPSGRAQSPLSSRRSSSARISASSASLASPARSACIASRAAEPAKARSSRSTTSCCCVSSLGLAAV